MISTDVPASNRGRQVARGDRLTIHDVKTERRASIAELAAAARSLADAVVETDVDPNEIAAVAREVRALAERLVVARHDGPYSGLHGKTLDFSTPVGPLPLSPIIGDCNPSAPDVRLSFDGDRITGTARLTKRHIGPPGAAHGGIGAMIADQLVALTSQLLERVCVTRSLQIRYLRPVPLHTDLELAAWCEQVDDKRSHAWCTISVDGKPVLEGKAEMVTAPHVINPPPRA